MFFCLVFLMLLRLFIAALWSPAGKGLTSWLLLVMFIVFCYFTMWYPGSCVVLIVSFPYLCLLSYFILNLNEHVKFDYCMLIKN